MSVAAVQAQNLLYVLGALAVAALWISGLYLLHHRRPTSMESGIESFSKGLRALAPPRRVGAPPSPPRRPGAVPPRPGAVPPRADGASRPARTRPAGPAPTDPAGSER